MLNIKNITKLADSPKKNHPQLKKISKKIDTLVKIMAAKGENYITVSVEEFTSDLIIDLKTKLVYSGYQVTESRQAEVLKISW